MVEQRKQVIIGGDTARGWWQIPDKLWRKQALLQRVRLRRTLSEYVLPVLAELENLYLNENLGTKPRLAGRTVQEIEKDDVAIEAALFLFNLAFAEELLVFDAVAPGKGGKSGKSGSRRRAGPKSSVVGSCGLTLQEVKQLYMRQAAELIVKKAGHEVKNHTDKLAALDADNPALLAKFRGLMQLDNVTLLELSKGLKGSLQLLMESDDDYLQVLHKVNPIKFLRALRYSLGDEFSQVLDWPPEFIDAVAEGLDHSAKITALGLMLLEIKDPEVVRALGTWEIRELVGTKDKKDKKRKYWTRIEQVKQYLGDDFSQLLRCGGDIVRQAGQWKNEEIERIRFFLPHLSLAVLEALGPLSFQQKTEVLEGLWVKLGREFIETDIRTDEGVEVLKGIVGGIAEMEKRGTLPKELSTAVESRDIFDRYMGRFLEK